MDDSIFQHLFFFFRVASEYFVGAYVLTIGQIAQLVTLVADTEADTH